MPGQPPSQEQRAHNTYQQSRPSTQPANPASEGAVQESSAPVVTGKTQAGQKPGLNLEESKATAGRAGERNLGIEWIDVWVGNNRSARFNLKTSANNGLEVLVEQAAYKKTYQGTGTVHTQVLPVAPIGTKGRLTARDTTTGETLEQPWTWVSLGGWGGSGLWEIIKRLIWKSAD